jgi:ABC-type multidrug transport system fused ATPase/permease subunit
MSTNTGQISNLVKQFTNTVTAGFSFGTFVVGAVAIAPLGAVALMAFGVVLFFALRPMTVLVRRSANRERIANREYARLLDQTISLSQEARTFGVERAAEALLGAQLLAFVSARRRHTILMKMNPQLYQSLGLLVILGGLAIADRAEVTDLATIGGLVLLMIRSLTYGQSFQTNYNGLASGEPYLRGLLVELERYEAHAPAEGSINPPHAPAPLALRGVCTGYMGVPVLRGVTFEIEPGESVGIIGPSGSGKSTLAAVLLGLLEPLAGDYTVNGVRSTEVARSWWARNVAFVPQEPRLFFGSVRENIVFMRDGISPDAVRSAAIKAHLSRELASWDNGLDYDVGPRGSRLSGGQRQRVCIARALAGNPTVLVLDEPTAALDSGAEESIGEVLRELHGQVTLVIVAHRLSTLEFCDRVFLVDGGQVREIGDGRSVQDQRAVRALFEAGQAPDAIGAVVGEFE